MRSITIREDLGQMAEFNFGADALERKIKNIGTTFGKKIASSTIKKGALKPSNNVSTVIEPPSIPVTGGQRTTDKQSGTLIPKGVSVTGGERRTSRDVGTLIKPPEEEKPSAFELRRQQAVAESGRERERQEEALRGRLAAQGLSGQTGFREARQRELETGLSQALSRRLGEIDVGEAQADVALSEAERQREFLSEENTLNREQARELAEKGFSLQETSLELQRQGIDQQAAQFTASQEQARYLAEKGFDQNEIRIELQRQGLDQQAAQFAASQAQQESQFGRTFEAQFGEDAQSKKTKDAILALALGSVDPEDPKYIQTINDIATSFGVDLPTEFVTQFSSEFPEGEKRQINDTIRALEAELEALPKPPTSNRGGRGGGSGGSGGVTAQKRKELEAKIEAEKAKLNK